MTARLTGLPSTGFTRTITVINFTGEGYVDGRYQEGTEVTLDIIASVQRLSMQDVQRLPEGYRTSETYKLYLDNSAITTMKENLSTVDNSSEFLINGDRFVMLASERWEEFIPHWKITVVRKQENASSVGG